MRPKKLIGIIVTILLFVVAMVLMFYKPLAFVVVMFLFFCTYLPVKYLIKKRGGGI